jgi:Ca2+-binding EF-hand superfamily protein
VICKIPAEGDSPAATQDSPQPEFPDCRFQLFRSLGILPQAAVTSKSKTMKHISGLPPLATLLFITGCATAPPSPTPEQSFKAADRNGDGKVSRTEYDAYMIGEMFTRFDRNHDSVLTEKEFLGNGGTAEGFRRINTSGSGKITLVEAKASAGVRKSLEAPFREADANRDGSVSFAEFVAYRETASDFVGL